MKLVGLTVRTNNAVEAGEKIYTTGGKILPLIRRYYQDGVAEKIANRKTPGTIYCAYTEYESDYTGDYTYFIGEEVTSFDIVPEEFFTLVVPAQEYVKFTNGPAAMPQVCSDVWEKIWKSTDPELGGKRSYKVDFEVYDQRATDHQNIVLDVFVGIEE